MRNIPTMPTVTAPAPRLWSIRIDFPVKPVEALRESIEAALEPFASALSSFETADGKGWRIEALAEEKPRAASIRAALKPFPKITAEIEPVAARDWVAESQAGLQPIAVGPFFIHGAHDRDKRPKRKTCLEIEAGMAFGTGRHETTMGCIKALLRLKKQHAFRHILDIGTGTGILAFVAWHLYGKPVLAGDNDRDAVRVARENAALNGLKKEIRVLRSDGYRAPAIRDGGPYDLITANILANPLIALAPDLARHLKRNGRAVLSGLLKTQEGAVLAAHMTVGLELDFRLRLGEWSVLVLKRSTKPGRIQR
ncbi:MAG TPA: 50S ribosomal protein L11 methyltransferase [Dongiaceae bacterium]|jgi:ribosomal protein L11 methyltransferase